jgi:GNAT superfamily N-acetyltransferase
MKSTKKSNRKKIAVKKTDKKSTKKTTKLVPKLLIKEARSDQDYHESYPILRQLLPHLDMQTYARRVFVARATGYRMFMGMVGKEVVGVIGLVSNHNLHDGFVTYIEHVVIDQDFRGLGYGTKLIQFAEDRAKEEGCRLIELDTDIGHDEAEYLYRKNGYVVVGKYHQKNIDQYPDPIFHGSRD